MKATGSLSISKRIGDSFYSIFFSEKHGEKVGISHFPTFIPAFFREKHGEKVGSLLALLREMDYVILPIEILKKGSSHMHWITPNIQLMFGSIKASYGRSLPVCRK